MELNAATVMGYVRHSLADPQGAARALIALNLPDTARWTGFALVIVLSALMGQLSVLLMGEGGAIGPVTLGLLHAFVLMSVTVAMYGVGRAMGGGGQFADAVLLVAWLQFIMVLLQVVQIIAMVVLPPLFTLVTIAALVVFLWMLTNFIAALHGFESLPKVFGMMIATFFAIAFVLAFLMALLGIQPPGVQDV